MARPWLLLQLADGSFPSGGFAHSGGLEAMHVLARQGDELLATFLDTSIAQAGRAALPFVRAAALDPSRIAELDDAYDATVPLAPPNRASRAQGRALVRAAAGIWDAALPLAEHARTAPVHHAPVFGALFGLLGVDVTEALAAYLHGSARGLLSAAVRLGLVGPLEAQRLLADRASLFDRVLERAVAVEDAAQTAPLIEIFAALHDRLDGRMFQS